MKKVSRTENCAGFEALQSGMEQDEGSRILLPTMKPLDMPKKSEKAEEKTEESAPAAVKATGATGFVKPKGEHAAEEVDKVESEPIFEEQVDFDTFAKSDYRAVKIKECTAVPKSKKLLKFVLDDGSGKDRVILSGIHDYYEPEDLVGKTAIAIVNLPPRKMMGIDSCGMLISPSTMWTGRRDSTS